MKDILLKKIDRFGGEDWFFTILLLGFLSLIITIFMFIHADKMVKCYYLNSTYSSSGPSYQLMAYINWDSDPIVFRSSDYKEMLDVYSKLPQCPIKEEK